MSGPPPVLPARKVVERIATEEARRARVSLAVLLGPNRKARAYAARLATARRVLIETGCSARGLAKVSGLNKMIANRAARSLGRPYDARTRLVLLNLHGLERAMSIIAGTDEATNADIEAWRNLGQRRGA